MENISLVKDVDTYDQKLRDRILDSKNIENMIIYNLDILDKIGEIFFKNEKPVTLEEIMTALGLDPKNKQHKRIFYRKDSGRIGGLASIAVLHDPKYKRGGILKKQRYRILHWDDDEKTFQPAVLILRYKNEPVLDFTKYVLKKQHFLENVFIDDPIDNRNKNLLRFNEERDFGLYKLIKLAKEKGQKFLQKENIIKIGKIEKLYRTYGIKQLTIDSFLPGSEEELFKFYNGDKTFMLKAIGAGKVIRRNQEKEILEKLLQERGKFNIVCITGGIGSGKITLLCTLAYELIQRDENVFQLIGDPDSRLLEGFFEVVGITGQHTYILIDQISQYEAVVSTLRNMKVHVPKLHELPVTILATSGLNLYDEIAEFEESNFLEKIELELCENEKKEFLQLLGKSYWELSRDVRKDFDKTSSFLVLGKIITSGKGFDKIIENVLKQLKRIDERYDYALYKAYEYVCFSHSFNIPIPEEILGNLDKKGRFYEIPEKTGTKGIFLYSTDIFPYVNVKISDEYYYDDDLILDSISYNCIGTEHQLIAKKALEIYGRNPLVILKEILEACDEKNLLHRKYFSSLINAILHEDRPPSSEEIKRFINESDKISNMVHLSTIYQMVFWKHIYNLLDQKEKAEEIVEQILSLKPINPRDCQYKVHELLMRGREQDAFEEMIQWKEENPDDYYIRKEYLYQVSKTDSDYIYEVLKEYKSWLITHPHDIIVRKAYLKVVQWINDQNIIEETLDDYTSWLKEHPDDTYVRLGYLSLVKDKGISRQIKMAVDETTKWLEDRPHELLIRPAFISLVKDAGNQRQKAWLIKKMVKWLKDRPNENLCRSAFIVLVKEHGTQNQRYETIEEIFTWLEEHLYDTNCRVPFFALVRDYGTQVQIEKTLQDTMLWLKNHPSDNMIRSVYLLFVRAKGFFDYDTIRFALDDAQQGMKKYGPNVLFPYYLSLIMKVVKSRIQIEIDDDFVSEMGYKYIESFKWEYNLTRVRYFADWLTSRELYEEAERIYQTLTKIENKPKTKFLFNLDINFEKELIHREITTNLKDIFQKNDVNLTSSYKLFKINTNEWEIKFGKIFKIKREKDELNVYRLVFKPHWTVNKSKIYVSYGKMILSQILKLDSQDVEHTEKIKTAEQKFQKALEYHPGNYLAYAYLAIVLREQNQKYEARIEIEDAYRWLRCNTNHSPGLIPYEIGTFYLMCNRYEEAIRFLNIANEKENHEKLINWWLLGVAKMELAISLKNKGQNKEIKELFLNALSDLEKALQKAPDFLQLPASEDIPRRIAECNRYLSETQQKNMK